MKTSRVDATSTRAKAIALDTLVEGVHFPPAVSVEDIAYKALAVNLSDLAAMGALPRAAHYSLAIDRQDAAWVQTFDVAIRAYAHTLGISVTGQVCQLGTLNVTVQAIGDLPVDRYVTRAGARAGDAILVTGTLGDAALGLSVAQGKLAGDVEDEEFLKRRLNRPSPQLQAGAIMRDVAHAGIDISDGLLSDLGHILEQSKCGATLQLAALPLSDCAVRLAGRQAATDAALSGGDDYELCITCAPRSASELSRQLAAVGCATKCIGQIDERPGLRCVTRTGETYEPSVTGWQHFT